MQDGVEEKDYILKKAGIFCKRKSGYGKTKSAVRRNQKEGI